MSIKEAWAADTDLAARDPSNLHDYLKVNFEEILAEPDHTHSIDCVWKYSYKCFNMWKALCYIIVSTLCGIIHAMCWGCGFACVAFMHIWEFTPCYRCYDIHLSCYRKFASMCFRSCVEPYCEACGAMFNAFRKG